MDQVTKKNEIELPAFTEMTSNELLETNGGSILVPIIDIIIDGVKGRFPQMFA